jgi:hypothetical protein
VERGDFVAERTHAPRIQWQLFECQSLDTIRVATSHAATTTESTMLRIDALCLAVIVLGAVFAWTIGALH